VICSSAYYFRKHCPSTSSHTCDIGEIIEIT
jgi:hypothetical protein